MKTLTLTIALTMALAPVAEAAAIKRACLKADRPKATRSLCSCIQDVADVTLSRADQKRGAKFFQKPEELQEVRQSDRASNERFWQEWKNFGKAAQNHCS